MTAIKDDVQLVVNVHVRQLEKDGLYGKLIDTADIVTLVGLTTGMSYERLRDYVAYCLREHTAHVCHYATGYRRTQRYVHQPTTCTDMCKEIDVHVPALLVRERQPAHAAQRCTSCNIELPINNKGCDICE